MTYLPGAGVVSPGGRRPGLLDAASSGRLSAVSSLDGVAARARLAAGGRSREDGARMTIRHDPPVFETHDAVGDRREEAEVMAREHDASTLGPETDDDG